MAELACKAVRERLGAWLDGMLSASEAARIETHLDACRTCAAEAAALQRAERMLAAALQHGSGAAVADAVSTRALIGRIQAAVRRETARRGGTRRGLWSRTALMIGQATAWGAGAFAVTLGLAQADVWAAISSSAAAAAPAILVTLLGAVVTLAVIEVQRDSL
ncbi:MAG TPA: zf-HC2 domain-containing protein [Limnochordia bacterium]